MLISGYHKSISRISGTDGGRKTRKRTQEAALKELLYIPVEPHTHTHTQGTDGKLRKTQVGKRRCCVTVQEEVGRAEAGVRNQV